MPNDRGQIFRRIAFNVMGVNRDDHTKNVAFLLAREWSLAVGAGLRRHPRELGERSGPRNTR